MVELGWDVHLVSWRAANSRHVLDPNVHLKRIVSPPHYVFFGSALVEIASYIRRTNPDIIHGHYVHTFGALAGLHALLDDSRPTVISAWGPGGLLAMRQPLRGLAAVAMRKADVVATTSPYLAAILRERHTLPAEKIVTFPWGIDTLCFSRGYDSQVADMRGLLDIPPEAAVLFSPRTVLPYYRIEAVVQAMGALRRRGVDARLVVAVGGSPDRRYLSSLRVLADQLAVTQRVVFIDRELTAPEMAVLYNMAVASVSVPRNDQLGSCVVEAMSCGSVPIVAPLEAYKTYLSDGDNALVVDGDNPEEIASAFERAVSDAALRERCRTSNPALVKANESWEVNSRKMEHLYRQLIAARKEPK